MVDYRYTQTWFIYSELYQVGLKHIAPNKQNRILEIGCYEGLSSVFFADNLLDYPGSKMVCVDPFMTIEDNDHRDFLTNNEEENFDYNIGRCKHPNRVSVRKITSDEFFASNDEWFNFIYIDGCHEPEFITRDMENSFQCLTSGGIMWMDDYRGGDGVKIKNTMDSFLEEHKGEYNVIHCGYQLAIKKI